MVGRVEPGRQEVPDPAVGLVLTLPFLVLHHAALLVELGLADGADEMPHAVGFEPERQVERRGGHVDEIVGAIRVGGAVQVGGAGPLERCLELLVVVLAAVEHQVLEEVSEAGPARHLVLRADVVPDVHGDDRRLVVLVHQQGEAVREDEALIGNVDGVLGGNRRRADQQAQRREDAGNAWRQGKPHGRDWGPEMPG